MIIVVDTHREIGGVENTTMDACVFCASCREYRKSPGLDRFRTALDYFHPKREKILRHQFDYFFCLHIMCEVTVRFLPLQFFQMQQCFFPRRHVLLREQSSEMIVVQSHEPVPMARDLRCGLCGEIEAEAQKNFRALLELGFIRTFMNAELLATDRTFSASVAEGI